MCSCLLFIIASTPSGCYSSGQFEDFPGGLDDFYAFVSSVSCLWRTSAFTFPLLDTRCVRLKTISHVINV
jgi:hypothetical protein